MKNKTIVQKVALSLVVIFWVAGFDGSLAWSAVTSKHQNIKPQTSETSISSTMWAQAGEPIQQSRNGPRIASLSTSIGEGGSSIITIKADDTIQYTAFKLLNPLRLVLDFPNMQKGQLSDSLAVNQGVVDSIRTLYFQEANVLRMEVVLNQAADYDIQKVTSNQLTIRLKKAVTQLAQIEESNVPESSNAESAPAAQVVNQESLTSVDPCEALLGGDKDKIDLDFQGASLQNIFRIFSEISGFNLIIANGVVGKVNIRLYDVPWNRAFQIILDNNQLGVRCIGDNIVRVATLASLTSEAAARAEAERQEVLKKIAEANRGELVTEVKRINYAKINDISANITALKSERGRVTVDVRTSTLILTDLRPKIDEMLALIKKLDTKTPQIMIEARIVEVSKNFSQELGIQWGLTGTADFDTLNSGNNLQITDLTGTKSDGDATLGNFLVDLGKTATATSGIGFLLGNVIGGLDLDLRLSALEATGRGRILSAPKVTTMDNREAKISSGRKIPFETTSADGTSTQFVDAELSLTVTPRVTSDDYVFLKIHATKNSADFSNKDGNGNPTILTNEARSEVIVKNGDTTVLGGIFENNRSESEEKVPFFSDIPLLGLFFQNKADVDTVNELLIFVTPTIIRDR